MLSTVIHDKQTHAHTHTHTQTGKHTHLLREIHPVVLINHLQYSHHIAVAPRLRAGSTYSEGRRNERAFWLVHSNTNNQRRIYTMHTVENRNSPGSSDPVMRERADRRTTLSRCRRPTYTTQKNRLFLVRRGRWTRRSG